MDTALYETFAGTGATMVAIIGGFALSKWLSIANEIAALDRSREDAQVRADRIDERTNEPGAGREQWLLWSALTDPAVLDELLDQVEAGRVNAEIIPEMHSFVLKGFYVDGLEDRGGEILDEARIAFESDWIKNLPVAKAHPPWRLAVASCTHEIVIEDVWRLIYDRECLELQRTAGRETNDLGAIMRAFPEWTEDPGLPSQDWTTRDEAVDILRRLHNERYEIDVEIRIIDERRERMVEPTDVRRTMGVLLITFALTVFPSIAMMGFAPARPPAIAVGAVLVAWALGSYGILAFMWVSARSAARKKSSKGLLL